MKLVQEYGLAGVAEWKLGFERSSIWDVIAKYVNQIMILLQSQVWLRGGNIAKNKKKYLPVLQKYDKIKNCEWLQTSSHFETLNSLLTNELENNVKFHTEWGKKRLAYEIQKMKEGFYYFIQFEADATAPAEIERHVRIMENVIRYLCVRQEA